MALPVRHSEPDQTFVAKAPQVKWTVAALDAVAVPSPVQEMQAKLEAALTRDLDPAVERWSARRSLAFVGLTSVGLWAGIAFLVRAVIA